MQNSMLSIDIFVITAAALCLFLWGGYIFRQYSDEIPVVAAVLNLCFLWRFFSVKLGFSKWITFNYGIPFSFNDTYAVKALYFIAIGMWLFIASYCWHRQYKPVPKLSDAGIMKAFCFKQKYLIIGSLILSFGLSSVAGLEAYNAGGSGASSYVLFLPLLTSSTVILGVILLRQGILNTFERASILVLIVTNISSTFVASGRFSMISWVLIFTIILFDRLKFRTKVLLASVSSALFVISFTILGMQRYSYFKELSFVEQFRTAFLNLAQFNDFNMVDGLIMLLQVVPESLNYSLGMGHLEIFLRPIPRAIWAAKPVGAWQQKLAIIRAEDLYGQGASASFFGTGISPTVFGDFYSEAGFIGIIVLSLLYGYWMAKTINFSEQHSSDIRLVIKGMLISFMFPLFRGGDLPGIVAIALMAYWPLLLFVWLYRKFLRRQIFSNALMSQSLPSLSRSTSR